MWIIEVRFTVNDPTHRGTAIYGPFLRLKSAEQAAKLQRRDAPGTISRTIRLTPARKARH